MASLRISYITSGAAGMFCGSCIRDNALAAALMRLGIDVQLVPTYTPIRTDERDVSIDRLFLGGINVYLQQKFPFFRHLPRLLDRPLNNRWLVERVSSRGIETDAAELGELTLSMLRGEAGHQRKEIRRLLDYLDHQQPHLVNLTNCLIAGFLPALKRQVRKPVLVTLQGDDLFLDQLIEPFRSKALKRVRRLAQLADGFIVFSDFYKKFMADYLQVSSDRFHVVPLGIDVGGYPERKSPAAKGRTVGYLARICPEKGFHLLIDAFVELRQLAGSEEVKLEAAGWLGDKNRNYFNEQMKKLKDNGLKEHFKFHGTLEKPEKIEFLQRLDVFSVPTIHPEPKGLFVLEALASGVPVVQPGHGSFPELVGGTGGGILVPPRQPLPLARAIHSLLVDPSIGQEYGETGRQSVHRQFTAEQMARNTLDIYKQYCHPRD